MAAPALLVSVPPVPAVLLAPPLSPLPAVARQLTLFELQVPTTLSCSAHAPNTPNARTPSKPAFTRALCPPETTRDPEKEKRTANLVSGSRQTRFTLSWRRPKARRSRQQRSRLS
jgi:hypothetical protein